MSEYQEKRYACIDEEPKQCKTKKWRGRHKGLRYEIKNFEMGRYNEDYWTYYVIIDLDQVNESFHKDLWLEPKIHQYREDGVKRLLYNDYKSRLNEVEWHGGITFYSKVSGMEHEELPRSVKFGCDYQHLRDEGQSYCLKTVQYECQETINQLITLFGEVKYYTQGDGKYRLESELT